MNEIEQTPANNTNPSYEKIITAELEGKLKAIAGYDEILWKIRAGYIGILYGSLTIILGTRAIENIKTTFSEPIRLLTLLLIITGFSISSYIVDSTYLTKKLKVIVIRDLLMKFSINYSDGIINDLPVLLAISGELQEYELPDQARKDFKKIYSKNRYRELFPIYGTVPILMLCIFLIVYLFQGGA